ADRRDNDDRTQLHARTNGGRVVAAAQSSLFPRRRQEDSGMNGKTVMACIEAAHATLKEHTEEIAALDQQIGNGDQIFNLLRGADALNAMRADIEALAFAPALDLAASKLLSTVGGSSGPLFYSLLHGMAKASESAEPTSVRDSARIFAAGVDAVAQRGKA